MGKQTAGAIRLRKGLKDRAWSQGDLARQLGVDRQTVYSWCSGLNVPRIQTLHKLERMFGIRMQDWFE